MKRSDVACRAIRAAKNEDQVIVAVQDYLKSLEKHEMAVLPADLIAFGVRQAEEAIHSALDLVHAQMVTLGESPASEVLTDVTLVFSTAARRLAVLAKDTA